MRDSEVLSALTTDIPCSRGGRTGSSFPAPGREQMYPKLMSEGARRSLPCTSLSQPLARTSEERGSCPALPALRGLWAAAGWAAANSLSHLYFIFAVE